MAPGGRSLESEKKGVPAALARWGKEESGCGRFCGACAAKLEVIPNSDAPPAAYFLFVHRK